MATTLIAIKTLHLLRHAKSDWSEPSLADHDRPLNKRGRGAALVMAEHLRGHPVDLVVCSTAIRARSTAAPIVEALSCPVRFDSAVYEAGAAGLVEVIRSLPDECGTVLVVGHNPGMEKLTSILTGTYARYPTAALGTIPLDIEHWAAVRVGCGTLADHLTPAELAGGTG